MEEEEEKRGYEPRASHEAQQAKGGRNKKEKEKESLALTRGWEASWAQGSAGQRRPKQK